VVRDERVAEARRLRLLGRVEVCAVEGLEGGRERAFEERFVAHARVAASPPEVGRGNRLPALATGNIELDGDRLQTERARLQNIFA